MKDTHRNRIRNFSKLLPAILLVLPLTGCSKDKEPEPPAYQGPSHPPTRKPPREVPPAAPEPAPEPPPGTPPSGG